MGLQVISAAADRALRAEWCGLRGEISGLHREVHRLRGEISGALTMRGYDALAHFSTTLPGAAE